MYDLVAGSENLKSSYVLSKTKALEHFPMLKKDKLVGAIVYYDGESQLHHASPHACRGLSASTLNGIFSRGRWYVCTVSFAC